MTTKQMMEMYKKAIKDFSQTVDLLQYNTSKLRYMTLANKGPSSKDIDHLVESFSYVQEYLTDLLSLLGWAEGDERSS